MKLSIITATNNSEKTIQRLINSLKSQTHKDFEWIVFDNASSDGTLEKINKSGLNRIVVSEPDDGIYDAWNGAVDRLGGRYAIFLGGDDFLFGSTVLEQIVKFAVDENKIYYGRMHNFSELSGSVSGVNFKSWEELLRVGDMPIHAFPPLPACVIPASYLTRLKFNTAFKIHSDADFFYRLIATKTIKFEQLDVDVSCMGDGGVTSGYDGRLKRWCEKYKIYKKYQNKFRELSLPNIPIILVYLNLIKLLIRQLVYMVFKN